MVRVEVFLPYPPGNKPLFQLWLSLSRAPPNLRRTFPHFDPSYFPLLSTTLGLPPQTLWVLHSYYTSSQFLFVKVSRIDVMPCLPSKGSKLSTIRMSLLFGEKPVTLMLGGLISTRMTASTPYVKEKRVSPIDLLGVVW